MKFRKRPIIVEAVRFLGDDRNVKECMQFCPPLLNETYRANNTLTIPTLEGKMICSKGDWIIKGVNGEFYPCKPDVFDKTYEPYTGLSIDGNALSYVKDGEETRIG